MMPWLPRAPLRRHRHAAGRAVRDAVAVSLRGADSRRRSGGAGPFQPAAPEAPADASPAASHPGSPEAWSRLQSGLAAGG